MDKSPWSIVLGLLRLALWDDESVRTVLPVEGTVWHEVRRIAREQTMDGILFDALNKLPKEERPPIELWLRWLGGTQRVAERNRRINAALKKWQAEMVPLFPHEPMLLKGQGAAMNWPEPAHRVAGDIDWLVGAGGWDCMLAFEKKLGLTYAPEREKHLEFDYEGVPVECHRAATFFYGRKRNRAWKRIEAAWMAEGGRRLALSDGTEVTVPQPGFDALFLFVHAFMHLIPEGVGLRQLTDWTLLLVRYADSIDRQRLLREVEELGMTAGFGAFGYAAVQALGLPRRAFPLAVDDYRKAGEWLLNDMCEGGNFGRKRTRRDESRKGAWSEELRIFVDMFRRSLSTGRHFGSVARTYPWLRTLNYFRKKYR